MSHLLPSFTSLNVSAFQEEMMCRSDENILLFIIYEDVLMIIKENCCVSDTNFLFLARFSFLL